METSNKDIDKHFLQKQKLDIVTVTRWIGYSGVIIGEPEEGIIVIRDRNNKQTRLKDALVFDNFQEQKFMRDKLNSEIVKETEPDVWNRYPEWQLTYDQTHKETTHD